MSIITMNFLLKEVCRMNGSDLHLAAGSPPRFRIDGILVPYGEEKLRLDEVKQLIYGILRPEQVKRFEKLLALDFTYTVPGLGRFRVNIHFQRGTVAAAIRVIPPAIKSLSELHLPPVLEEIALQSKGLVLVTGPTGCGKSTTLASMIDIINTKRQVHIITIEDPIEYTHSHRKAMIEQMEVGSDTPSFAEALKYALRQDPDVILVGEMRDLETISMAITAAETGHLVLATLHTPDAAQTISRIIDVFPTDQQSQIRSQLSLVLKNIISQQLLCKKGGGRIPAYEVLHVNSAIANLIRQNKIEQIYTVIETGSSTGMISLRQSLQNLLINDLISWKEARQHADRYREDLENWYKTRSWDKKSTPVRYEQPKSLGV